MPCPAMWPGVARQQAITTKKFHQTAFVNTLCSNRFHFINTGLMYNLIILFQFLCNVYVGLLKYLSCSVFLDVEIIK